MSFQEKEPISPVSGLPILDVKPEGKAQSDDVKELHEKAGSTRSDLSLEQGFEDGDTRLLDSDRVITTGEDVSRYLLTTRDDGDPALTFRSIVLGTVFAGLGAAMSQIYLFKPIQITVSTVFLLLLIYSVGEFWAFAIPRASMVKGTRLSWLAPFLRVVNPGPFALKEHVVASLVASTAAGGSSAVMNFAVQRLYYDTNVHATTAILATFSTACFGYGLVGLLRPLTVYPSEMVYWGNLPMVSVFQALHFDNTSNHKRSKLFWTVFSGMFVYEIIPAYIFPLLDGVNIVCLATQRTSSKARDIITNFFGGIDGNEGLGFFSFSFDWQYVTSTAMSYPLTQQANSWVGMAICYIAIMGIYYSNTWNSLSFPMLSTSLFSSNGTRYPQSAVFGTTFTLNQTALDTIGLPALTGSNAWHNLMSNLAIGSLITHCCLFWGPYVVSSFKQAYKGTQPDPHYQAMKKYKEAPWYWYAVLLVLAFAAGLIVVFKGETTLPWWSYIVSLLLGAFITPFSTLLYARLGNGIATNQLMKMVAGAINPGRPVANLYFSMWSHDVVSTSINLAGDLKMGQYLKVPPRVMFLTQVYGTILGAIINYVIMVSIVDAQREILLDPIGTNVWSGQYVQSLNSAAVTWSLAKQLYGPHGPYFIIPMGILIGVGPTLIQWLIAKRWKKIGPVNVDDIMLPVIYMFSAWMASGSNSPMWTTIIVGVLTQYWLRRSHPRWFKKYNYILGGALDGGSSVMIFILSFAVFGASGKSRPFPTWAGNPAVGNTDYCNGNGALD